MRPMVRQLQGTVISPRASSCWSSRSSAPPAIKAGQLVLADLLLGEVPE